MDKQTPVEFSDAGMDETQAAYNKRRDVFQIATASLFMDYQEQVNLANMLAVVYLLNRTMRFTDDEIAAFMFRVYEQSEEILESMQQRRTLIVAKPETSSIQ